MFLRGWLTCGAVLTSFLVRICEVLVFFPAVLGPGPFHPAGPVSGVNATATWPCFLCSAPIFFSPRPAQDRCPGFLSLRVDLDFWGGISVPLYRLLSCIFWSVFHLAHTPPSFCLWITFHDNTRAQQASFPPHPAVVMFASPGRSFFPLLRLFLGRRPLLVLTQLSVGLFLSSTNSFSLPFFMRPVLPPSGALCLRRMVFFPVGSFALVRNCLPRRLPPHGHFLR